MENSSETPPHLQATKRRQFVNAGARCLALGSIATFAAFQEIKRRRLDGDPSCIKLHTCTDCVELGSGCKKEKAVDYRTQQGI